MTWTSGATGGGVSEAGKGILDALDSLKKEFSLDTNRFYITGLSMGGAGTYHMLATKPGYFAGAAPCAAGGDSNAIASIAKTPIWHSHGSLDGTGGRRMANAMEKINLKVVRFVSQAAITTPQLRTYSDALKNGTKAEDLCFKNPTPPVTYDSLKKAVEGGANHLYSELTGGDHRSGWMIAWHNPLMAKWMFSKVKGGAPRCPWLPRPWWRAGKGPGRPWCSARSPTWAKVGCSARWAAAWKSAPPPAPGSWAASR